MGVVCSRTLTCVSSVCDGVFDCTFGGDESVSIGQGPSTPKVMPMIKCGYSNKHEVMIWTRNMEFGLNEIGSEVQYKS